MESDRFYWWTNGRRTNGRDTIPQESRHRERINDSVTTHARGRETTTTTGDTQRTMKSTKKYENAVEFVSYIFP